MTAQPDPQQVREMAREVAKVSLEDTDYVGIAEQFCDDDRWPADEDAADALHRAIADDLRGAVPSWPDEQSQAERDSCIHCGRDFSLPYVTRQTGTNRCEDCTATCGFPGCGHPDHQRADCPDLVQAERDADVRAVDNVIGLLNSVRDRGSLPVEIYNATCLLVAQFGGRIEAMDVALDAGEPDPSGGA